MCSGKLTLDERRVVQCVDRGRDTRQAGFERPFDSLTRRVTYPESYITKYTTYIQANIDLVERPVQGFLAYQKTHPPRTVPYACA